MAFGNRRGTSKYLAIGIMGLTLSHTASAAEFALRAGDRVAFYGDSITEQRLYTTYAETFLVLRYPDTDIRFRACGVGGDTVWGGWTGDVPTRLKRDLAPFKPNVVTILLGMNDAGYTVPKSDKIYAVWEEYYRKLIDLMGEAAPGAKFTLMQTPPYDDLAHPGTQFAGYNDVLLQFGKLVGQLAEEKSFGYVDMNRPVWDLIQSVKDAEGDAAAQVVPDGIHPGPAGHLVMAQQLLNYWHAEPLTSEVTIDWKQKRAVRQTGSKVSAVSESGWTQLDEHLPFPLDGGNVFAAKYGGFNTALNRQTLAVTGLDKGNYELKIDGKPVATHTESEWAKGVDLSLMETPMRAQAMRVLDLTNKRNEADYSTWFRAAFMFGEFESGPGLADAFVAIEDEARMAQRKAAYPVEHRFTLDRVG